MTPEELTANPLLSASISYALAGWPVFPVHSITDGKCSCGCSNPSCTRRGKHPRTVSGLKDASTSAIRITEWWSRWPDANIGVVTGKPSGLVVLDIDPRNGGDVSLLELCSQFGQIPTTIEAITGSLGRHILFAHPKDREIKNSAGIVGPGIDVRADGGYFIAAPSVHYSGRPYVWEGSSEPGMVALSPIPDWLLHRMQHRAAASAPSDSAPKIKEGTRNPTLASYAGSMRRKGFPQSTILAALLDLNETLCEPPLDPVEVRNVAYSISRYAPSDPILIEDPKSASGPYKWRLDELADANLTDPETFFADLAARGSILLLSGRRGVGKTYFTLALAACIAIGRPFGDFACRKGKVLYLSQEMSASAIRKRIRRLFCDPAERKLIGENLTIVCKHQFKLDSDEAAKSLVTLCAESRPDVVFLDALRDVKGSAKENSNDDMGGLMVRLRDSVSVPFDCAVILLHHKGKPGDDGQDRGSRGASALEDVAEDVIYLAHDKNAARRSGAFEKTREGTLEGKSFWFEITNGDDPETVLFSVGSAAEGEEEGTDISRAKKLADILHEEGAMTRKEIRRRMSWTESTCDRTFRAGRQAEILVRIGGVGGRGSEAKFDAHDRWKTHQLGD